MSNADIAIPEIQIRCRDRVRTFCLNNYAWALLEVHMREKLNDPKWKIWQLDKQDNSMDMISTLLWVGMASDAKEDPEPWTLEKCRENTDAANVQELEGAIALSLKRCAPPSNKKKVTKNKR